MPSTTLVPITDQTTTGWTNVGGATFSASLDEGIASADDTTSYVHISSGTSALQLTVTESPATFTSAISCDWAARCASVSDARTHTLELQIFESDGATAITDKPHSFCLLLPIQITADLSLSQAQTTLHPGPGPGFTSPWPVGISPSLI